MTREDATLYDTLSAGETIVIFTSDNGGERFSDIWPFSGKKTELLEGGLRIPPSSPGPAPFSAGRVSEQVTAKWIGCRPCSRPQARRRTRPSRPME